MSARVLLRTALSSLMLSSVATINLPAQQANCTYERCALRLKQGFWSGSVVQGSEGTKVARTSGFVPSRVPLLAEYPDSLVRLYHDLYRSAGKRSTWLWMGGLTAIVTSFIVADEGSNAGAGIAFLTVGLGLGIWAGGERSRSIDRLSQSLWRYNRQFAP